MVYILVSAAAFGAMAIFARYAQAAGADVMGILVARFAIAGALLAALMVARGARWPTGRPLAVAIGMGGIGYVGQAFCYFSALEHASAGLVALLLYAYPAIVCLIAWAFLGERISRRTAALAAVSFAGIALTVGGGHGTPAGFALGLGAALFYSAYIVVGARELRGVEALASATIVCLSAAATLALASAFHAPRFPASPAGWIPVLLIAVVSTVLAILAFFAGLKRVGPAAASIGSTLEPVVTVALAWLLLGETLSAIQVMGGILVLGSAAWLAKR